jgi:hypothetical protein
MKQTYIMITDNDQEIIPLETGFKSVFSYPICVIDSNTFVPAGSLLHATSQQSLESMKAHIRSSLVPPLLCLHIIRQGFHHKPLIRKGCSLAQANLSQRMRILATRHKLRNSPYDS